MQCRYKIVIKRVIGVGYLKLGVIALCNRLLEFLVVSSNSEHLIKFSSRLFHAINPSFK